jgi:hypothetical protein
MGPDYYVSPAPQSRVPSRKILLLGIGLVAAVIVGVGLLLAGGGKDISKELQRLTIRLSTLQAILDNTEQTRNIKNEELSRLISEFSINLASDTNTITPLLSEAGVPENVDPKVLASETDTTGEELEEAALNNKLDSAMKETIQTKIRSIRILMAEIYPSVKTANLKKALETLDTNLSKTAERLEKIRV